LTLNRKEPASGEWIRTFAILATATNELVAQIHYRMPAILKPEHYERWLVQELDPHELLVPFPSGPLTMWSTRRRKTVRSLGAANVADPRRASLWYYTDRRATALVTVHASRSSLYFRSSPES
jgi:putative SOS response-associated peptidase YedK